MPNITLLKRTYHWFCMSLVNHINFKGFFEPLIQIIFTGWSVNKYRAKILNIRDENKNVYSLVLKVSTRWRGFKAGQHIEISVEQNGAKISRIFSISSPTKLFKDKRIIELTIRKQNKGRITPWLPNGLIVGQYINVSTAQGDFALTDINRKILLIAGGTGITPFRSMISECINTHSSANLTLMYYAKNSEHLFSNEFNKLQEKHNNLTVSKIDSKHSGHISLAHLQKHCADFAQSEIYICGPSGMIKSTEHLLMKNCVDKQNIHHEYFGAAPISKLDVNTEGSVEFIQSSLNIETKTNKPQSLLDMAEAIGLKPMTGCRKGICHQCICQKQHGVVYNTLTKVFSDTGSEEVQLCVSVPVGDVSINL